VRYDCLVKVIDGAIAHRGSLRRLQADRVAIAQLHWSAAKYAPLQEAAMVRGLGDCFDAGLCRAVGVSNYGPKQLRKVRASRRMMWRDCAEGSGLLAQAVGVRALLAS
jgi:diketogulonate reductase-like aldo/keto reductase